MAVGEISRAALDILLKRHLIGALYVGRCQRTEQRWVVEERFCLADTDEEAERWCRWTERELEGRI